MTAGETMSISPMATPPMAGWNHARRLRQREEERAQAKQGLAKDQRHEAADDPQRRIRRVSSAG